MNRTPKPPEWMSRLLRWFHPDVTLEEVEGDLEELYVYWYKEQGKGKAAIRYALAVVSVLPPFVRKRKPKQTYSQPSFLSPDMVRNYLIIAWRSLIRNKAYSFINLFGLALGIASCLMVALFARYEYSFDAFHTNRIYRLGEIQHQKGYPPAQKTAQSMFPMGPTLKNEFPEISDYTRIISWGKVPLFATGKADNRLTLFGADASMLRVFNFNLLKGDPIRALAEPNAIVLTQMAAQQLFGSQNPIGQMVHYWGRDTVSYRVTGVLENIPAQSHLQFDAVFSMSTEEEPAWMENWEQSWMYTYLQVAEKADIQALEAKFPAYLQKYLKENAKDYQLFLQALDQIHLQSADITHDVLNQHKFDQTYIYLLLAVALFVLALASINYINLTTARSAMRAKEVGVRKTNGATWQQLAGQFLTETLLFSLLALLLAYLIVFLSLPLVNILSGRNLQLQLLEQPSWLLISLVIALGTGLLSGIYPAVFLASLQPMRILKGKYSARRNAPLRHTLVVAQFATAILLTMSTLLALQQLKFIHSYDVGFSKEQVAVIPLSWTAGQQDQQLMESIGQIHGVAAVTGALRRLGTSIDHNPVEFTSEQGKKEFVCANMFVDYNYLPFYDIELLAGRNLSPDFGQDRNGNSYIINETLANQLLSYSSASKATFESLLGKPFKYSWMDTTGTIVGICRDFNFNSLHHRIEPLCLTYQFEHFFSEVSVRFTGKNTAAIFTQLEKVWEAYVPDQALEYYFLDQQFDQLYQADKLISRLVAILTGIIIVIACLGLIGLATYSIETRTKEIGIRKVLGASIPGIVVLLSKDFIRPVLIAFPLAMPLSWWLIKEWLSNYAYRIELTVWPFLVAGISAIVIAILTISYQSIKAALANPVEALRNE